MGIGPASRTDGELGLGMLGGADRGPTLPKSCEAPCFGKLRLGGGPGLEAEGSGQRTGDGLRRPGGLPGPGDGGAAPLCRPAGD